MRGMGDVTSANIFEAILGDEEEHIDYLETQLGLLSQLGEQHYVAQLIRQPDDD
jgi:bacterioferritin